MADSLKENMTIDANSKETAVNSKEEQKVKITGRMEKAVQEVMKKTGWSREEAEARMETAKKWAGISFVYYNKYDFYNIPEIEQKSMYNKIAAEVKQRKAEAAEHKAEAAQRKRERQEYLISLVTDATGWDKDYAEEMIKRSGAYKDYALYGFWELSEEERETYFTVSVWHSIRRKYDKDSKQNNIFRKDTFCKSFEKFFGRPCMATTEMTLLSFKEKFKNTGKIIYKPRSSGGGRGIEIFEFDNDTIDDVYDKICLLPDGVVEGLVIQHPEMQKLSIKAVNTIRIVTIFNQEDIPGVEKNKVHFLYAALRMAVGNNYVDNFHCGGIVAGVNMETGILETDGVRSYKEVFVKHPDTGTVIKGFQIPYFNETKKLIEAMYAEEKGLPPIVGWDMAIAENGPVVIEANPYPDPALLQLPYAPEKRGMRHVVEKYLAEPEKDENVTDQSHE